PAAPGRGLCRLLPEPPEPAAGVAAGWRPDHRDPVAAGLAAGRADHAGPAAVPAQPGAAAGGAVGGAAGAEGLAPRPQQPGGAGLLQRAAGRPDRIRRAVSGPDRAAGDHDLQRARDAGGFAAVLTPGTVNPC